MTILETIKRGPGRPPAPQPEYHKPEAPGLAVKIAAAEEALARAQDAFDLAAYENAVGKAPEAALTAARATLASAKENLDLLRVAHTVALRKDAAHLDASRQAIRKTQLEALRKHCEMRDKAAVALVTALSDAAEHYRKLIEHSEKAIAATPIGGTFPQNGGFQFLDRLVAQEMQRISAANGKGRTLPGGHIGDLRLRDNPDAVVPLVDTITKTSADVVARLTKFVKGE